MAGVFVGADGQPGNTSTSTGNDGVARNLARNRADAYNPPPPDAYTFASTVSATGGNGTDNVGTDATVIYQGGGAGVGAFGGSALTFNGGSYSGGNGGTGYGLVGGSGGNGLRPGGGSTALVNAGTFTGGSRGDVSGAEDPGASFSYIGGSGIALFDPSVLTVTGGHAHRGARSPGGTLTGGLGPDAVDSGTGLLVFSGTANLYGGTFNAAAPDLAGDGNSFDKGPFLFGGTATLYGTNYTVNGVPVGSGEVADAIGTITGILRDNNGVETSITYVNQGGTVDLVDLVAAPEPTSLALLAAGCCGLLGRGRRRGHGRDSATVM